MSGADAVFVGAMALIVLGNALWVQRRAEVRLLEIERLARGTWNAVLRLEATVVMMDAARRMEKESDRD